MEKMLKYSTRVLVDSDVGGKKRISVVKINTLTHFTHLNNKITETLI